MIDKARVTLPVLCRFLRCKSAYGAVDDTEWQEGTSSTEVYWCLATMEPFGPDDSYAHATACRAGRACFRADESEDVA
jgi:hypothetical protein